MILVEYFLCFMFYMHVYQLAVVTSNILLSLAEKNNICFYDYEISLCLLFAFLLFHWFASHFRVMSSSSFRYLKTNIIASL